jgi:hypothetical protein
MAVSMMQAFGTVELIEVQGTAYLENLCNQSSEARLLSTLYRLKLRN